MFYLLLNTTHDTILKKTRQLLAIKSFIFTILSLPLCVSLSLHHELDSGPGLG